MHRDIIFDHRFVPHLEQVITFDFLGGTLGIKKGQKLPISLKATPTEAANLHRKMMSHQRFDTSTHLGDKSQILTLFGAA